MIEGYGMKARIYRVLFCVCFVFSEYVRGKGGTLGVEGTIFFNFVEGTVDSVE